METEKRKQDATRGAGLLGGAIAVVAGCAAVMAMFAKLTESVLIMSYKGAEFGLVSVPAALLPQMLYSLAVGIAAGLAALLIAHGLKGKRARRGPEDER